MVAHVLSPYILGVLVLGWQAAPPGTKPETKTEAQPAAEPSQESLDERYETLLAAARKDPGKANWIALRRAFAQTSAYNPYNVKWRSELAEVRKLIEDDKLKAAETALDKLLQREGFMRLDGLSLAVAIYEKNGEKDKARTHQEMLKGIADTLFVPEHGLSFEKPFVVLFIDEEYLVLRTLRLRHESQSLRMKDGHHFDVFTIPAQNNQPEREVFFNIDMPFGTMGKRLQEAFDKGKKPQDKK